MAKQPKLSRTLKRPALKSKTRYLCLLPQASNGYLTVIATTVSLVGQHSLWSGVVIIVGIVAESFVIVALAMPLPCPNSAMKGQSECVTSAFSTRSIHFHRAHQIHRSLLHRDISKNPRLTFPPQPPPTPSLARSNRQNSIFFYITVN